MMLGHLQVCYFGSCDLEKIDQGHRVSTGESAMKILCKFETNPT